MSRGEFLLEVQKLGARLFLFLTLNLSYNRVRAEYEHSTERQDAFNHAYYFSPKFIATALRSIVGNSATHGVFSRAYPHANPDSDTHRYSNASSDRYPYSRA